MKFWKMQSFNFSRLTEGFLNSMVTVREMGVTPALWDTTDVSLTEHERQRVEAISSLAHKSILLMNDATIWSRAIYPLLVLAEQGARGVGATAFEGAISSIRFGGDCRWSSGI